LLQVDIYIWPYIVHVIFITN